LGAGEPRPPTADAALRARGNGTVEVNRPTQPAKEAECLPAFAAFAAPTATAATTTTTAAAATATATATAAAAATATAAAAAAARTAAATATATAAAAATAEATTAAATATRCALLGFIDNESASVEFGVVHLLNRGLRGSFFFEGYEAETA